MNEKESQETPERPLMGATTEGIPVAPSLEEALNAASVPLEPSLVDRRVLTISVLAMVLAFVAAVVARVLTALIGLVTNLCFYGRFSTDFASPANHRLGPWVVVVPVLGGIVVGIMARYGSRAIRGHGIPEAMEQVLTNESKIAPRVTLLKPLSSAVAIGTGGPFGAEGPIIATGGALGSLIGQLLHTSANERKTLLAAGAAAGMTAIFGSPVSAVILAVELLLFELRPRSIIPVALACATAAGARTLFMPPGPVFAMPSVAAPSGEALTFYIALGALIGVLSVYITRFVYAVEDAFERLPIHWMWWPALGGLAVGIVGYFAPKTLGVGYENIGGFLNGKLAGTALLVLCVMKLISWAIALGSGTSGGTLAPLFTIGGGLAAYIGSVVSPWMGVDSRIAGLVGMAAIFAGASRALLASVVFAFETTLQPMSLLPLLGGCTAAYLVSCLMMRNTIMTEKIVRRGVRVPSEYAADFLAGVSVGSVAVKPVITLASNRQLGEVRDWLASHADGSQHQGFPIVGPTGKLIGLLTRRDLLDREREDDERLVSLIRRPLAVVYDDMTLRDAADHMVGEGVGRLPVVTRSQPLIPIGILTRSDLLSAHQRRLRAMHHFERGISVREALGRSSRPESRVTLE